MTKTAIYATPEEIEALKKGLSRAQNTPAFGLSSAQVLSGNDFASMAWRDVKRACHYAALQHGLPEIEGFYGIDLQTGEFLRY